MKSFATPFVKTFKNFLPLKQYFLQNRWPIALGLVCLLVVDFLQLLIPLVIKKAIDLLTMKTATTQLLVQQGIIILSLALMIAFFRYVWRYFLFGHSRKVEKGLRNRIYMHLQTLSLSFYNKTKTGDLMARAINDINAVRMATGMGLVALTDGLVLGMAAIGFMLSINVRLTLISLIPAPIIILLTRVLTRRMSTGFENVQKTFSDLTERAREVFAGIRVIKAYNRESWAHQNIEKEGQRYVSVNMGLAKTLALELAQYKINVNVISPGAFDTNLRDESIIARAEAEGITVAELLKRQSESKTPQPGPQIPLGRMGKPEDIADLVLFLVSDLSSYITGEEIQITGGAD